MSSYLRKVRTASGATAVQVVAKERGVRRIVEHLGPAHDQAELAALMEVGRRRIAQAAGQGMLDLDALRVPARPTGAVIEHRCSALLWQVLTRAYECLGLDAAVEGDAAFMQMVLARLVEPTSKAQVPRPRRGAASKERNQALREEPVWDPQAHPGSWRAIWAYSARRFARDNKTLTAQENRARQVVAGQRRAKGVRFVTTHAGDQALDENSLARAKRLAGLEGYVTNIPASTMDASEVIASYHELWHVEQSFRMSEHDLAARPVFHHTRDAIEAHLTIVMASLAIARHLQQATGITINRIIQELRGLQEVTININGHHLTAQPQPTHTAQQILHSLTPTRH